MITIKLTAAAVETLIKLAICRTKMCGSEKFC